ncbi:hypothetical protein HNQ07_000660 [Deinococcus metalli]|uniref:DUF2271 domain-containing protein n=1 Tax=Deinococcus metalli TaxID=1141878 RepID=A0A7W8NMZ9_9DEIO|nr:DUF2271 domain-containing protein [Deinococcus metalli]MBB5375216.1 hypothetical protein [Deinococcus metalli]GHF30901.1 hypothetical protein GCM10017781_03810 [Deinococcus metalli]
MTDTRRRFLGKLAATAATLTLGRYAGAAAPAATGKAWASGMALDITFTVATKAGGYIKRPFVAVYIEDAQGTTVRNLTVWLKQGRLNPRWLAELRRWTRQNGDLVETVSSATRNPGTYAVSWDGKDDKGKLLPQGEYYVVVESAREHGPYSLVREKVTVGAAAFKKAFTADNDIEAASVSFGKA